WMIDYVGPEVRVVLVGLSTAPSARGVGQERVPSRHLERQPIGFRSSPWMLIWGVDELRLRRGSATIGVLQLTRTRAKAAPGRRARRPDSTESPRGMGGLDRGIVRAQPGHGPTKETSYVELAETRIPGDCGAHGRGGRGAGDAEGC